MQEAHFEEILEQILAKDSRYHRDAYLFLTDALKFTQKRAVKDQLAAPARASKNLSGEAQDKRNVSGQELLDGIREYALQEFGPMAVTVLNEWGIRSCRDFGEIVFHLVEHRYFKKTEQESVADFDKGYDFDEAFRKPFLPRTRISEPVEAPKPAAV
jgi:uncharacterized repeat protein (TIGR04138 family)